ncbi:hypothetical protein DFH11DRAFT_1725025 [Phellopilus nigrolimitatus]|nr:hypothetical protein DFH11DRAFT_1725025 [Phellopilus nigrolimitatus]
MPRSANQSSVSPFVCIKCGRLFTRSYDLSRHLLIHGPNPPTHQNGNMKDHIIATHLKLTPHPCTLGCANKSFGSLSALIHHEKQVHGHFRRGRKPYARSMGNSKKIVHEELDQLEVILHASSVAENSRVPASSTSPLSDSSSVFSSPSSIAFPSIPSELPAYTPGPFDFFASNVESDLLAQQSMGMMELSAQHHLPQVIPHIYPVPAPPSQALGFAQGSSSSWLPFTHDAYALPSAHEYPAFASAATCAGVMPYPSESQPPIQQQPPWNITLPTLPDLGMIQLENFAAGQSMALNTSADFFAPPFETGYPVYNDSLGRWPQW